ncbi:hypothetical protein PTSG_12569 [Salpingoeca rosetta]|uniref:PPM-type phosphatase domain-containing protein n=1 Tax=Salpingoeca rosetta (strain ATCC 50818 / BSB-021) TaxID=946362 RepID=F2UJ13_SALR5|nr:uncharacterized protein PTSG_12569 [Salpingoeca rosetta]EGD76961.1 hypothetical protein PTSG_12569 [Salpingoeca rosetta]|eukprot:XP_004990801.1 hypothetical protein PTSG_12569 [Salpingoeca rosetta]
MSLFRKLSSKKKVRGPRTATTHDEPQDEQQEQQKAKQQGQDQPDQAEGADDDGMESSEESSPGQSRLRRTPTKKGVFRRVFSFKRNTSTTAFEPAARKDEDVDAMPTMEVAWTTDLGFHHEANEDKATIIEDLFKEFPPKHEHEYNGTPQQKLSVFAVFDGHGGYEASEWAQTHLHQHLSDLLWRSNYDDKITDALHHSFKATEDGFCEWAKKKKNMAGSCATCVVIKGRKVFCGNAGDSKAMIIRQVRKQTPKAADRSDLNHRHGSHLKSERVRIKKAGGRIAPDGSVYGVLFPTRGFGDIDVKADGRPVVICTPDGAGFDKWSPYVLDTDTVSYLVIASDGLWDFVSDKDVEALTMQYQSPKEIAVELTKEARMGGSEDDITIIVVRLSFAESTMTSHLPTVVE